jgi:hypothetical protein
MKKSLRMSLKGVVCAPADHVVIQPIIERLRKFAEFRPEREAVVGGQPPKIVQPCCLNKPHESHDYEWEPNLVCPGVPQPETPRPELFSGNPMNMSQGGKFDVTHPEMPPKTVPEIYLRQYMWAHHTCGQSALYGDDGELQCKKCLIDFRRMPMEKLREKICMLELASPAPTLQGAPNERAIDLCAQVESALQSGNCSETWPEIWGRFVEPFISKLTQPAPKEPQGAEAPAEGKSKRGLRMENRALREQLEQAKGGKAPENHFLDVTKMVSDEEKVKVNTSQKYWPSWSKDNMGIIRRTILAGPLPALYADFADDYADHVTKALREQLEQAKGGKAATMQKYHAHIVELERQLSAAAPRPQPELSKVNGDSLNTTSADDGLLNTNAPRPQETSGELISAIESLLEWVPKSGKGSSGYLRVERVKAALQFFSPAQSPQPKYEPFICNHCGIVLTSLGMGATCADSPTGWHEFSIQSATSGPARSQGAAPETKEK